MDKETILFLVKTLKELIADREQMIDTIVELSIQLGIEEEHKDEFVRAYKYQNTLERYADAIEKESQKIN